MNKRATAFTKVLVVWAACACVLGAVFLFTAYVPSLKWLGIFAVGAGFVAFGAFRLLRAYSVRGWAQVHGTIRRVSVESFFEPGQSGGYLVYFPIVQFDYLTNEGTSLSGRYALEPRDYQFTDESDVEKLTGPYQPGMSVSAFMNPQPPHEAVLVAALSSRRRSHYLACMVGGVLICGVAGLVAMITQP